MERHRPANPLLPPELPSLHSRVVARAARAIGTAVPWRRAPLLPGETRSRLQHLRCPASRAPLLPRGPGTMSQVVARRSPSSRDASDGSRDASDGRGGAARLAAILDGPGMEHTFQNGARRNGETLTLDDGKDVCLVAEAASPEADAMYLGLHYSSPSMRTLARTVRRPRPTGRSAAPPDRSPWRLPP